MTSVPTDCFPVWHSLKCSQWSVLYQLPRQSRLWWKNIVTVYDLFIDAELSKILPRSKICSADFGPSYFPGGLASKESTYLQCGRSGFDPWVEKIPLRRKCLPTLVFWPREFHGLYTPWGHKELDTTEWLHFHFSLVVHCFIPNYAPESHKNFREYTMAWFSTRVSFASWGYLAGSRTTKCDWSLVCWGQKWC